MLKRLARAALTACALVTMVAMAPSATAAPSVPSVAKSEMSAAAGQTCYQVWQANVGAWSPQGCDGEMVGSVGEGRAIEALALASGVGGLCLQGHVQDVGDQAWSCETNTLAAVAGTQGQSRRLEGVHIHSGNGLRVCARAHVQDEGWQATQCGLGIWVGTSGQGKRMEAIQIWRP